MPTVREVQLELLRKAQEKAEAEGTKAEPVEEKKPEKPEKKPIPPRKEEDESVEPFWGIMVPYDSRFQRREDVLAELHVRALGEIPSGMLIGDIYLVASEGTSDTYGLYTAHHKNGNYMWLPVAKNPYYGTRQQCIDEASRRVAWINRKRVSSDSAPSVIPRKSAAKPRLSGWSSKPMSEPDRLLQEVFGFASSLPMDLALEIQEYLKKIGAFND